MAYFYTKAQLCGVNAGRGKLAAPCVAVLWNATAKARKTLAFSQTQNLAFLCGAQGWCTKSEHCEISNAIGSEGSTGNCLQITMVCSDLRGDTARRTRYVPKSRALTLTRLSDGGYHD